MKLCSVSVELIFSVRRNGFVNKPAANLKVLGAKYISRGTRHLILF